MTGPDLPEPTGLTELMRRESEQLDHDSGERILGGALAGGARRRRGRQIAVGLSGLAAAAVVTAGAVVVAGGPGRDAADVGPAVTGRTSATDPAPSLTTAPTTPTPEPTYDEGSATEVPDGPVIPTDRIVVDEEALGAEIGYLLLADRPPGDKTVSDDITKIRVRPYESSSPTHMADRTMDGRRIAVTYQDAAVVVVIQRWDGYAAVGVDLGGAPDGEIDGPQKTATTAGEACAGSYRAYPPITCTQAPEGWYWVDRPAQGVAAPAGQQELMVAFYTPDGYVIRVDATNVPPDGGEPVAPEPVLTEAEALRLARSPVWFRQS